VIGRSYEKIEDADLARLAELAREDRDGFFRRNPRWRDLYATRIVAVALCQGAAQHFVDGRNGIKDFDVWTFFAQHSDSPFPYRRRGTLDFGPSKFGRWPEDRATFIGRRVDLLARSLPCSVDADPVEALRRYLSQPTTKSAAELAHKAAVLLEPIRHRGMIVWPVPRLR